MTQTYHLNARQQEILIEQEFPFKRLKLIKARCNRPVSSHPLAGLNLNLQNSRQSFNLYSFTMPGDGSSFLTYNLLDRVSSLPHFIKDGFYRLIIRPESFVLDQQTEVMIEMEIM